MIRALLLTLVLLAGSCALPGKVGRAADADTAAAQSLQRVADKLAPPPSVIPPTPAQAFAAVAGDFGALVLDVVQAWRAHELAKHPPDAGAP